MLNWYNMKETTSFNLFAIIVGNFLLLMCDLIEIPDNNYLSKGCYNQVVPVSESTKTQRQRQ